MIYDCRLLERSGNPDLSGMIEGVARAVQAIAPRVTPAT